MRPKNILLKSVLFSAVFLVPICWRPMSSFGIDKQSAYVSEVLTGDTLRLKGGKLLRYIGVDAPPLQSKIPLVRQYGEDAFKFNQSLIAGKKITIEWGSQIKDVNNNLLGYVFLEDGTFVNLELVKAGHAKVKTRPPNVKYRTNFIQAELEARRARRGLWKEEPENPFLKYEYIGDKNTKIYYYPTSPELEDLPQSYLVTFSSRVAAKAAGYRPCHDCRQDMDGFSVDKA